MTVQRKDAVVDPPPFYLSSGETEQERQTAYKKYLSRTVEEYEIKLIREALQRGQLTGSDQFREEVEKKHGIRISNKKQGRPGRKK